jgi:hypothetical protein
MTTDIIDVQCFFTESDDDKAHAGNSHNKFTANMTCILTQPNSTCEQSSLDDSNYDVGWSGLAKFNDEDNSENDEDHGIPSLTTKPLPIVEPIPYSYAHALTGVPMTASMNPSHPTTGIADDIAFLIGHADGIVQSHQLTPIPTHVNRFRALNEVNDKVNFTQNMHGMIKGEHKRILTKAEKQLDQSAQDFNLLLFSSASIPSDSVQDETRTMPLKVTPAAEKKSATKYRRLSTSPITVPGTPDYSNPTEPKRPKHFPHPNYGHRNTNYKQPTYGSTEP